MIYSLIDISLIDRFKYYLQPINKAHLNKYGRYWLEMILGTRCCPFPSNRYLVNQHLINVKTLLHY